MKKRDAHRGVSLVELLVYIAILSIITTGLIRVVIVVNETSSYLRAQERIAYSATVALETLTREIRGATAVDVFSSNFGSSPGTLVLDVSKNGIPNEVTFSLEGNRIVREDLSGVAIPLTERSVYVEALEFTHVANLKTEGVLVQATLSRLTTNGTTTKQFQTFVVVDM